MTVSSGEIRARPRDFRVGHGSGPDWHEVLETCVGQIGAAAETGGLGLFYVTDAFAGDIETIGAALRERTGLPHWLGASAPGIIGNSREYFAVPAMTVMVSPFSPDHFGPLGAQAPGAGDPILDGGLAVVHGDSEDPSIAQRIAATAQASGRFLVGGLTVPGGKRLGLQARAKNPLDGVKLAPDLAVSTGVSQGCTPIGPVRRITGGERNVVLTLDDRPALEVLKEEAGEVLARRPERIGGYIFAALPVPGSDTGDYLVRNIVGYDDDLGAIGIGDLVERGAPMMFCRRDAESARTDLVRMVSATRDRLDRPVKGALYISCLARGPNLFGDESQEIGLIQETLGGAVPTIGFFANGEIFHDRLYTYTGVLTLFG